MPAKSTRRFVDSISPALPSRPTPQAIPDGSPGRRQTGRISTPDAATDHQDGGPGKASRTQSRWRLAIQRGRDSSLAGGTHRPERRGRTGQGRSRPGTQRRGCGGAKTVRTVQLAHDRRPAGSPHPQQRDPQNERPGRDDRIPVGPRGDGRSRQVPRGTASHGARLRGRVAAPSAASNIDPFGFRRRPGRLLRRAAVFGPRPTDRRLLPNLLLQRFGPPSYPGDDQSVGRTARIFGSPAAKPVPARRVARHRRCRSRLNEGDARAKRRAGTHPHESRPWKGIKGMKSSAPETLLWIGPRRHGDFVELFRQAESLVPQIAYRSSLFAALDRPATRVDRVLIARVDSCGPLPDNEEKLRRLYPQADIVTVTGSLCTARPATRLHESTGNTSLRRVAWHQAGPFLRGWLANRTVAGGRERTSDAQRTAAAAGPRAASIAVFASRYSDAEALLDLADADGAAAFWCRSPAQ